MEAPPLERKLVAIFAADVEGYSRLMGIDEEGTLRTLSEFRSITDDRISQHGGRFCGTAGDSILAACASALAAVQCAIDIQKEFGKLNEDVAKDRRHVEGWRHFRRWGEHCSVWKAWLTQAASAFRAGFTIRL
jgi:adenylate cyclase